MLQNNLLYSFTSQYPLLSLKISREFYLKHFKDAQKINKTNIIMHDSRIFMLIFGDFAKSPCHPKGRLPKLDLPRDLDSVNVLSRLEVK